MNKLTRFSIAAVLAVTLMAALSVGLLTGMPGSATPVSAQETTEPATIPLGPAVQHIDPYPWGLMYRHAAEEANLPGVVELVIHTNDTITTTKSLNDQITGAGGSHVSDFTWRVPIAALTPVVQRADVMSVRAAPGATGQAHIPAYDRMSGSLLGVVQSNRDNNVPASQAALKAFIAKSGKVAVIIDATSATQKQQIRTWLTGQSITPIGPVTGADTSENVVAAMVPVGKVVALSNAFTTARLYSETYADQGLTSARSTWPTDFRTFETELVTFFTSGTVPS